MIRLGLVGAGRWGRRFIETIAAMPSELELAVVASRNPETKGLVPPACRVETDWHAALEGVDGVVIASPPGTHGPLLMAAIESGVPALVEKPLTLDPEEALAAVKAAQRKGAVVLVDHVHLFSAAFEAFQREAPALGKLKALRTEGGNWGPFRPDVGPLWDYAPHDVSFCIAAADARVESAACRREEARDGGETLRIALAFSPGLAADIRVSNLLKTRTRLFEARYERGLLAIEDAPEPKLTLQKPGEPPRAVPLGPGRPLERALRAFAKAVASKDKSLASLRLGAEVVDVLAGCQKALG